MSRLLLILLLLPLAGYGQQIFRTTDENGNVVFTDRPGAAEQVEKVELQRTNSAPPPPDIPRQPQRLEAEEPALVHSVEITSPADETTIAMGPGNFSVTARAEPAPGPGEALLLRVDGEPWGDPQQSASWQLTNVFRGAHDLTVSMIAENGEELAVSAPIRVYVLRPSVNFRK